MNTEDIHGGAEEVVGQIAAWVRVTVTMAEFAREIPLPISIERRILTRSCVNDRTA